MRIRVAALFLFACICPVLIRADHLPEGEVARGKADTVLSGVDVYKSTARQVTAKLGTPTKVADVPSSRDVAGGRDYEWQRDDARLQLWTWNDKDDESVPYSAEVWGTKPAGGIGITGRGLKLGATLADVRRLYGARFSKTRHDDGTLQVIVQWQDETTLYLYFDRRGHIDHMHLLAQIE